MKNFWVIVLKDGTIMKERGKIRDIIAMYTEEDILSMTRFL